MEQHTDSHLEPAATCYSCGRASYVTHPFGRHPDGTVATRVCSDCAGAAPLAPPRRTPGGPTLAWTTLARADRLVALGAGRTPDHVLRQGLALLERHALDAKGSES